VLEGPQLLELFEFFERARRRGRKFLQSAHAIGVQPHMSPGVGKRAGDVAVEGDRRTAEIQRPLRQIGHYLHHVRIVQLRRGLQRHRERGDIGG
jgi:hypothetical protein